jgi:predicted amidohydrolase YtcJ
MSVLFRRADVRGRPLDVRIRRGVVAEVADRLPSLPGEDEVDARGGALLPGLHDHHLHLLSMAAALGSVACGPPAVTDLDGLAGALRGYAAALAPGSWVRGTGYHESVAGPLDRHALDRLLPDRPLRLQHRGGALWMLNSAALAAVGSILDDTEDVERDERGRPTGRLWRYDGRLRRALPRERPPLDAVGRRLVSLGVTGVTDATPDLDQGAVLLLGDAVNDGSIPSRVHLLGTPLATTNVPDRLTAGPYKLLLRDHDLPGPDTLTSAIAEAHSHGRGVAVHCVTRASLILTLVALEQAGPHPADRIEHAAVVPSEMRDWLVRLRLRVVTQPGFIADRGDGYLADVAPEDLPHLYPYATLLADGIPVAPSSDAPFGELDPWAVIAAAVSRRTRSGATLGPLERVAAIAALRGYLSPPDDPGGRPRRVEPGVAADLCLLHEPLATVLREPSAQSVRLVTVSGEVFEPGAG